MDYDMVKDLVNNNNFSRLNSIYVSGYDPYGIYLFDWMDIALKHDYQDIADRLDQQWRHLQKKYGNTTFIIRGDKKTQLIQLDHYLFDSDFGIDFFQHLAHEHGWGEIQENHDHILIRNYTGQVVVEFCITIHGIYTMSVNKRIITLEK